jgi:hypothetical protein
MVCAGAGKEGQVARGSAEMPAVFWRGSGMFELAVVSADFTSFFFSSRSRATSRTTSESIGRFWQTKPNDKD